MNKNIIVANFKKEFWEYKKVLTWVPLVTAVLMIIIPALNLMLIEHFTFHNFGEFLSSADGSVPKGLSSIYMVIISGIFAPFIVGAIIVQLYYLLSCLFDERRDLSVYFWRSLPVSDLTTIVTKLLTGACLIPAIFLLFATALTVFFAIMLLVGILIAGIFFDTSLWGVFSVASLFVNLMGMWAVLLPMALWLFPIYAWLMLASVFATRAPFLWAILPIILLLSIEAFLVSYMGTNRFYLAETIQTYLQFSESLIHNNAMHSYESSFDMFTLLLHKISIPGIVIGTGLLACVYWLRRTRSHG